MRRRRDRSCPGFPAVPGTGWPGLVRRTGPDELALDPLAVLEDLAGGAETVDRADDDDQVPAGELELGAR